MIYEELKSDENLTILKGAIVLGNIEYGKDCSIWFNSVIRSEGHIKMGDMCALEDFSMIHSGETETIMGNGCVLGHGATLHGATLGDNVLIGINSTVLDGAKLGNNCFVAAGSLVTGTMDAPDNSFIMGAPARVVRPVTEKQIAYIKAAAENYAKMAKEYKKHEK